MQTETITFKARHATEMESKVLRSLRLSERPLTMDDLERITRLRRSEVLRTLTRLFNYSEVAQTIGGFIASKKGEQAVLTY